MRFEVSPPSQVSSRAVLCGACTVNILSESLLGVISAAQCSAASRVAELYLELLLRRGLEEALDVEAMLLLRRLELLRRRPALLDRRRL